MQLSHLSTSLAMSELECGSSGAEDNITILALALALSAPVKCTPSYIVSALIMAPRSPLFIDLPRRSFGQVIHEHPLRALII